ncbi:hypothetical protein DIPPA_17091 [Diplonema papillatum]|nr:hypothetical protein DIPPA_17091 [Diplonema papillatum]
MHRPCHRRTSHLQKLPCLRKLHTEELQRGDSGEEEDLCLPELPAGGPRPPVDAHNARQTFEQRVTREKLRRDIAQFTPHQVFRECLVLFDKHPEVYGPLWRLFEEEHRRIVAEKVSGQHCAVAGSLWGDLVGGHSQFQKEAKQRNRERVLAGQNQALRDEVAALTDKMERAEDDAIRWKASSDECMAVAEKLSGIVEALKADLADANQQVLRVTGKNLQLATVNETYAEGDERKLGEKQMMLLEEIDVLKSANEALILEMKSYRQEADERKADQSQAADDKTAANARVAELFRTIKRLTVENKALADERDQLNSMLSSSNSNGADITSSQPADDYIVESFIGRGNGAHIPKYLRTSTHHWSDTRSSRPSLKSRNTTHSTRVGAAEGGDGGDAGL